MIFKMYVNGGIYRLDDERGKGKIYEIINKSNPKRIKNIFSEQTFADVPTGTYYFYIDDYKLEATWSLGAIYDLLTFVHRLITASDNVLMTIDYEGNYSYVVGMQYSKTEVRLIFLDRKEPDKRDWFNRYNDPELKNTVVVNDVIISRYEFIKQFRNELKRIYEENKYYLSKEYEEKCKQEHAGVCQEYVLSAFEKYFSIFDRYLENPEIFWKESFFDRKRWDAPVYKTVSELKKQFDNWKKVNVLIGSKIEKIMIMGIICNDDRPYFTYRNGKWYGHEFDTNSRNNIKYAEVEEGPYFNPDRTEDVSLTLDEPLSIFVRSDDDIDQHFDIDFTKTARFMMKPNSFDFWEKSIYARNNRKWQDVSRYFSKNIIGHKIVDINIEAYSKTDEDIDLVEFVMDNGYRLSLETDLMTGYMSLSEEKPYETEDKGTE